MRAGLRIDHSERRTERPQLRQGTARLDSNPAAKTERFPGGPYRTAFCDKRTEEGAATFKSKYLKENRILSVNYCYFSV